MIIVLHHHEITLKGKNRPVFERQLMQNVRRALDGLVPSHSVGGGYGRFVVESVSAEALDRIAARLSKVFGLANICAGLKTEQDVAKFCEAAEELLSGRTFATIKVDTRRVDKNFALKSIEVNAQVGEYLCKRFGVRADLKNPDETVFIEIVNKVAYVYRSKLKGAGGLPVGVSGKVVALLSAGFDSPVASYQIMKRGASVLFVHFHSHPYVTRDSVDQVRQLVDLLTEFQFQSKLYVIPFGEAQQEIVAHAPPSLRVVLYRRFMVRIAEAIALREKAQALVTGESLGQVASQTLRNIRVIDGVASLPILRPLIGTDKEEIIALAQKIGTYEISRQPYDDCCSYLTPRQPDTSADPKVVEEAESKLDVQRLVAMCLEKADVERFSFGKEIRQATA